MYYIVIFKYWENKQASLNSFKANKSLTFQIEHEVIDANTNLNVALVRYETGWRKRSLKSISY